MRISDLSKIIPGADEQGVSLLSGYQSTWRGLVVDADAVPLDLTGQMITAKAEIYRCQFIFGTRSVQIVEGTFERIKNELVNLDVTIANDQVANPGRYDVDIPEDLIGDADIEIDSNIRVLAIIYIERTAGNEKRPCRGVVFYGKGTAKALA